MSDIYVNNGILYRSQIPYVSGTLDLGSSTKPFSGIYANHIFSNDVTKFSIVDSEVPTPAPNGVNQTFNILHTPLFNTLELYKDGILMNESGLGATTFDYVLTGTTIIMESAPFADQSLVCNYRYDNPSGIGIYGVAYVTNVISGNIYDGQNLGSGEGIFTATSGSGIYSYLQFKSLVGDGVVITSDAENIYFSGSVIGNYVQITGSTMTGDLQFSGGNIFGITNLEIDSADTLSLNSTNPIIIQNDLHPNSPATQNIGSSGLPFATIYATNYDGIDLSSRVAITGDTMTGNLNFSGGNITSSSGLSITDASGNYVLLDNENGIRIQEISGSYALMDGNGIYILNNIDTNSLTMNYRGITLSAVLPNQVIEVFSASGINTQGNIYPNSAGGDNIGSISVPYGQIYAGTGNFHAVSGLSPINVLSDLNIMSGINITADVSGSSSIGTQTRPFQRLWVTEISGVQLGVVYTGTSPISVSGDTISIASGSSVQDGYISSSDWNIFNDKQPSGNYLVSGVSNTDALLEGISNLYYLDSRVSGVIATQKAQANGLATLNAFGQIPDTQLPPIVLSETYVVPSFSGLIGLPTGDTHIGVVGVVTDTSMTYILQNVPSDVSGNWIQLLSPPGVVSVNSKTGAVSLSTDDIPEGTGTNLYYTYGYQPVNKSGDTMTGDLTVPVLNARDAIISGIHVGNSFYTGLLSGGQTTAVSTSGVNIASGVGVVVNNTTNPSSPSISLVNFGPFSGVIISDLSAPYTQISITDSGTVYQKAGAEFTSTEQKSYITLATVLTPNSGINGIQSNVYPNYGAPTTLCDLINVIGSLNVDGNVFSASGTSLSLAKSAGHTFNDGVNYYNDVTNPNKTTDAPMAGVTFQYKYKNGSGGYTTTAPTTTIVPNRYDDGTGVLGTVAAGDWSVQRIYFAPITNKVFVHYGQAKYPTFAAAKAAYLSENFTPDPTLSQYNSFRCWLVIRGNTANLADTVNNLFIAADKYGATGGVNSATTTLQVAYDNSTTGEIVTDATRDGLTVKEGAGVGLNLFDGQNSAGQTVFSISASGNITIGSGSHMNFGLNDINPAWSEGRIFYDDTEHTLSYYNDASGVTVNIGQENLMRVSNFTGETLTDGIVVHINGASGSRTTVAKSIANDVNYTTSIGVITNAIPNSGTGYITTEGIVHDIIASGIGLSGVSAGTRVYLSPTVSGNLTEIRPVCPNFAVPVGYITYASGDYIDLMVVNEPPITPGYGSGNSVLGMDAAATRQEYKRISGTNNIDVVHSTNLINISGSLTPTFTSINASVISGTTISGLNYVVASGGSILPAVSGITNIGSDTLPFSGIYVKSANNQTVVVSQMNEVPAGTIDGANAAFTLTYSPFNYGIELFKGGLYMIPSGVGSSIFDYVLSGTTMTFIVAPASGISLIANYNYQG